MGNAPSATVPNPAGATTRVMPPAKIRPSSRSRWPCRTTHTPRLRLSALPDQAGLPTVDDVPDDQLLTGAAGLSPTKLKRPGSKTFPGKRQRASDARNRNSIMTKPASSMVLSAARCDSVASRPRKAPASGPPVSWAVGIERTSAGSPALAFPERTEWSRPLPASEGRRRQPELRPTVELRARSTRYPQVPSPSHMVASSQTMMNISFDPRSSSQGIWKPRNCASIPAGAGRRFAHVYHSPMTTDLEQLRGEVERLVYSSEEPGFTICRLVVPGRRDLVTVAGTMPGIQPGERLHLRGRWINHPVHGYQFRADSYSSQLPASANAAATWPQAW